MFQKAIIKSNLRWRFDAFWLIYRNIGALFAKLHKKGLSLIIG